MSRVLLVTNDFPPRRGGIQSYLQELVDHLVDGGAHTLTVYAPKWKGSDEFDRAAAYEVVRHPGTLMLPEPSVAGRMRRLVERHSADTVWFGAAAPLALMAPLARDAGARRVIASTHGHEVGWSMLPLARTALRRIGSGTDAVTYISRYTRAAVRVGVRSARSAGAPSARRGHRAVRARRGRARRVAGPLPAGRSPRRGLSVAPGAAQGSGHVDPGVACDPATRARRRAGDRRRRAVRTVSAPPGAQLRGLRHVVFTDGVPGDELPAHHAMADVFAMPCRTRGAGLDVEGLGIVYLEASASGVPVVAGRSGGAPETVLDDETGLVVDGWDVGAIAATVSDLLADPDRAARMGAAGRRWVVDNWQWKAQAARLADLL